ncbi:HD domain-containing protein [Acidithiobacillus montserratensis]|uniref:HD domain-containing protein n=1 Tax=Acidithiobacillus montserratensis TaxID=2729135 RepID=A0ACD5HGQ3_9PROT|nr:HD domain-containing protein [Acidithiobacillus montserratensis]MBU2747115.1 hypothetical protein [Acidithiobacillus montserratensis]
MPHAHAIAVYQRHFILSQLQRRTSRYGQPFCACYLTSPEGRQWMAYWWQAFPYRNHWPDGVEVYASVRPRRMGRAWILDIIDLQVAALVEVFPQKDVQSTLPGWLLEKAVYPTLLRELWAQIHMFSSTPLRSFNQRILHDPEISLFWVTIPASHAHHHAEAGGLLRHSVEALRLLSWAEAMTLLEWEVARTAVLWHDVGKILGYDAQGQRTMEGWTTAHEEATSEVLATHLAWLRRQSPELVTALKIHWSGRTPRPLMPGRILVESCDRMSAALDSRRLAFAQQPAQRQFAQLSGPGPATRFWRLRPGIKAFH